MSFFSLKGYADGIKKITQKDPDGVIDITEHLPGQAAGEGFKQVERKGYANLLVRTGSRAFGLPVSVTATAIDYAIQPPGFDDVNYMAPSRFGLIVSSHH